MSPPLLRRQPFKGLYIVYLILSVAFIRLPWWFIRYLPRRNRPRPTWPLLRCLIVTAFREILTSLATKLGIRNVPSISDEGLKNARLVWIEPLSESSSAFCGEVRRAASITRVRPAKIPAYWNFKPGTTVPKTVAAEEGERTALHIHGGAFHLGSAHPDYPPSNMSQSLLDHSRVLKKVLAVEYRLSAAWPDPPINPFPAALLDCIAAYMYLVKDAGFEPKNITVIGDSAGGNIAFALVRHLVENSIPELAPPGRLLSCSPWLDLTMSRNGPESSLTRNRLCDIIGFSADYPRNSYLGSLPLKEASTNRYLSPVSPSLEQTEGLFKGFSRTLISAGDAEVIMDDSVVVVERLKKDGVDVEFHLEPDAVHDFSIFPWHEPERTKAIRMFCRWLDDDYD